MLNSALKRIRPAHFRIDNDKLNRPIDCERQGDE